MLQEVFGFDIVSIFYLSPTTLADDGNNKAFSLSQGSVDSPASREEKRDRGLGPVGKNAKQEVVFKAILGIADGGG